LEFRVNLETWKAKPETLIFNRSDCGSSSQATFTPEIHPTVVWAKFKAMAEGAKIATKQLWS
jgi:5-methyltetrahydropteroyltriglutamate--homocysteine methyltransferase